jgi:hypothetical protein
MILKKLEFNNFCKFIGNTAIVFTPKTKICGANKSGKTTVKSAILWICNSKDDKGKEIAGIRPHDEFGNPAIDEKESVAVTLTIEKDGTEITLTKIQKQTKSGGTSTDYMINGFKCKATEYEQQIKTLIPSEVCLNPQAFLILDMQKRRALIIDTFGNVTNDEVIALFPEYEILKSDLSVATTAQIKKKYADEIKRLTKERDTKIVEINIAKQKADVDISDMELHLNALTEQINENRAKQTDIDKSLADMDKLTKDILDLKFEESELIKQANAENIKARGNLECEMADVQQQIISTRNKLGQAKLNIENLKNTYDKFSDMLERQREHYKRLKEVEFDESSLVCAYCGQEYPKEKKDELRAKYEATKQSELKELADDGLQYRTARDNAKDSLATEKKAVETYTANLDKLNTHLSELSECLAQIPREVDVSDMPRINEIRSEIAEKDKLIKSMADMQNERTELLNALLGLQSEYNMVQIKIEQARQSQDEVDNLTDRQRELSQLIADNERMKDLVEQFDRAKCKLAEDKINSNFEVIKFKLFETQINGEIKDVCRILVDGEDYERNLNHGSRILAEIDLCRAFQKAYNVELPIMVDDLECLDTWRIPNIPNQLIGFMRTDDKKLIVEEF